VYAPLPAPHKRKETHVSPLRSYASDRLSLDEDIYFLFVLESATQHCAVIVHFWSTANVLLDCCIYELYPCCHCLSRTPVTFKLR